jgi:hypothetical protein
MKTIVIWLFCTFLLCFITSCTNEKRDRIINELTDKYWDVYRMKKASYEHPKYGFNFKNNKVCVYYFYAHITPKKIERIEYNYGEAAHPKAWSVKSGSQINILGLDYKILRMSEDTIVILNALNNQDTLYLKKAPIDLKLNSNF